MKFLLFAVLPLLVGQRANACQCVEASVKEAREWADVVFAGEVTKVQYVDAKGDNVFDEPRIIVTVRVSDAWKGDVRPMMTLHTVYNKVSCDGLLGVKQGGRFIVYAKRFKGKEWLKSDGRQPIKGVVLPKPDDDIFTDGSFCRRSGPLAQATEDLKALGTSKKQ